MHEAGSEIPLIAPFSVDIKFAVRAFAADNRCEYTERNRQEDLP
jgi:hypothetical protein